MDAEFLSDIEKLRNAQTELDKLTTTVKPWADYISKLRDYIVARHFHNYVNGKHTVALPDGSEIELEKGENVAVREELLEVTFNQIIDSAKAYAESARAAGMEPMTPAEVAALNSLHRLVVWKPSLSKRDYDKLPKWAQDIFEQALTRSLAKPKLTIKDARNG